MRGTKPAHEIEAGDKIYTTESPNLPRRVTASYALGEGVWVLEVEGIKQMLQTPEDALVETWSQ